MEFIVYGITLFVWFGGWAVLSYYLCKNAEQDYEVEL
jgi:hypothetical protein